MRSCEVAMNYDKTVPVRVTVNDRSAEFAITFSEVDRAHAALGATLAAAAKANPRLQQPSDAAVLDLATYVDGAPVAAGGTLSDEQRMHARQLVGFLIADLFAQDPDLWDSTAELGLRLTVPERAGMRPFVHVDWMPEL
jgi:hypothetical protein